MRGWIHTYAVGIAAVGVAALVGAAAMVSTTAAWSTFVYGVTVCGVFGVSAAYHRVNWGSARARIHMKRADHSVG
ncbi:hemolysin III family protein [Nocardia transvalensis]|nr:hemolysin III family protein [Nocardia transvalensis]